MLKALVNRGRLVKLVGVLSILLMCAIGTLQVTHSHHESTSSHHTCSICATAHAGLNTHMGVSAPVLFAVPLPAFVAEAVAISRPAATQFIRPPPVLPARA